jgi:hypothetical protein
VREAAVRVLSVLRALSAVSAVRAGTRVVAVSARLRPTDRPVSELPTRVLPVRPVPFFSERGTSAGAT